MIYLLYIPIWFYSNVRRLRLVYCHCLHLYIPIWFYSNSREYCGLYNRNFLYIPIWFYSNERWQVKYSNYCDLYIPIWFYSNGASSICITDIEDTLHSNLVLFKLAVPAVNISTLVSFTFQSGSIQMKI